MRSSRAATPCLLLALGLTAAGCVTTDDTGTSVDAIQCTSDGTIPGVDVSTGNGAITWSQVRGAGIRFAFMKATQGTGYTDPRFAANWSGSRAAGVLRGAYHFFDPTADGVAQAHHYLSVVGPLAPGDLPPMLDIECPDGDPMCLGYPGGSGSVAGGTLRTRMMDWLNTVQSATGRTPVIYTFGSYFSGAGVDTAGLATYPLFIANVSGGTCFSTPAPWTRAPFWQWNWHGVIAGIPGEVDQDRFMGTAAELTTFANGGAQYAAQFVAQSWPFASVGPVTLRPGEHLAAYIEMRNVGTHAWDANTRLATTVPRDRTSPLAGPDWVATNRPSEVHGTVAPGGTYRFNFTLVAPDHTGTFDEHFGFVEDRTAWFSDPGQGGPADSVVEMHVVVAGEPVDAGGPTDAGTHDAGARDAGTVMDTGTVTDTDASVAPDTATLPEVGTEDTAAAPDGGAPDVSAPGDGGAPNDEGAPGDGATNDGAPVSSVGMPAPAGCGCAIPGTRTTHPGRGVPWALALATLGILRRRPRRACADHTRSGGSIPRPVPCSGPRRR